MRAIKKVELLAPAGNAEAFYGAVHAGADAIYLGGSRFRRHVHMRRIFRKMNWWTVSGMLTCLGRKVYLTVNTLVKESEFSGAL